MVITWDRHLVSKQWNVVTCMINDIFTKFMTHIYCIYRYSFINSSFETFMTVPTSDHNKL